MTGLYACDKGRRGMRRVRVLHGKKKTLGKSQYDCMTRRERMAIEAALVHWLVQLVCVSETLRVAS